MENKLCNSCKYYKEHLHISGYHKMKMCTASTSRVLSLKDIKYKTEECGLYKEKGKRSMNLQPLDIKKEYVFNIYYNPNTNNSYDIKKVKQVVVKYKDNTMQTYELQYDTDYMRDMGCSSEIVKCFIFEELKDFTVRLYLSEILDKGHEVFVVDGDKYEIQPEKKVTIEELLEEKAEIEELLKDKCLLDTDKAYLIQRILGLELRIANLKMLEETKSFFKW